MYVNMFVSALKSIMKDTQATDSYIMVFFRVENGWEGVHVDEKLTRYFSFV